MYCNIQLITNIIDLIHKFGMYSRFGYNRQICQGRILYMHSTKLYTINTRQNRLFIKYINNKRCLPLVERVLFGDKIMVQDYMITFDSYTPVTSSPVNQNYTFIIIGLNVNTSIRVTIKIHINTIHIFVLINIQCTFKIQ